MDASFSDSSDGETVGRVPGNTGKQHTANSSRPRARATSDDADSTAVEDVSRIETALRRTQLSASDAHSQAQRDARDASSVSSGSTPRDDLIKPHRDALRTVAQRILFQCVPWPAMWMVSEGHIIASSPSGVGIATASDELGIEILSYVPRSLVPVFLTEGGQRIVGNFINQTRRPKVFTIRGSGELIFGPEFKQSWFVTGYPRENEAFLAKSLGATEAPDGKTAYAAIPPIFYPDGNTGNWAAVFMNQALIRLLKVLLYGPSMLDETKAKADPKSFAIKLKLREATPGMIAFAATLARYMLSPDQEFQEKGSTTDIDYQHAFIKYKGLLSENTPQMNGVLSHYTQELFNPQRKQTIRPPSSATSAVDSEIDQLRRKMYGNATDSVTKEVPPPLPRKSSVQPEDHSPPAPASPTQSERHVSISITSSVSQTLTASSRVSNTTNDPPTPEHDDERPPSPQKPKASRPAPRKKKAATADASSGDLDDASPAAGKRSSNKRGKASPAATPPERSLRQRNTTK